MTIKTHMLAYGQPNQIRMVEIPDNTTLLPPDQVLEVAFVYGQNALQPLLGCPSVSLGDVFETDQGELWLIVNAGFKRLTPEDFSEYCSIQRRDRQFSRFMEGP